MKLGFFLILLGMFSIQFGASLAKKIFGFVSPIEITALRISLAAIFLWVTVLVVYRYKTIAIIQLSLKNKNYLKWMAIYGLSLGLMNLFFYLSLQRIPLGLAVSFEFVGPLGVAIFYSKSKKDFFWLSVAILGLIGLFYPDYQKMIAMSRMQQFANAAFDKTIMGTLLALIAGGFWGFYIIFGKKASHENIPNLFSSAVGMTWAALVGLGSALVFTPLKSLEMGFVLKIGLGVAILSSVIPYTLEMIALKKIKQNIFGILMSIEPVIASIIGFIFLNEKLENIQMLSMMLVVGACIGVSRSSVKYN